MRRQTLKNYQKYFPLFKTSNMRYGIIYFTLFYMQHCNVYKGKVPQMAVSNYRTQILYNKENIPPVNCLKSKKYTGIMNSACVITWEKGRRDLFLVISVLISFSHSLK